MPTYEYECKECGKVFEKFESIKARAKRTIKTDCQQCNGKAPVTRLIGAGAGVIFKGSGFYETDYRSDSYKKAAKADSDAAAGKSDKDSKKSDTKTEKSTGAKTDTKSTGSTPKSSEDS